MLRRGVPLLDLFFFLASQLHKNIAQFTTNAALLLLDSQMALNAQHRLPQETTVKIPNFKLLENLRMEEY